MQKLTIVLLAAVLILKGCSIETDREIDTDICIYGGTSAGVIAAYAASMEGKDVILVEPGNRVGGLSSGGLGQTDIGNKFAVTGIARDFYRRAGNHYGTFEQWTFEPSVALEIFESYLDEADVEVLYEHRLHEATTRDREITGLYLEKSAAPSDPKTLIRADVFIDCSYEGDLMAASGVSYTVGRESNEAYNENYNGVQLRHLHQFPDSIDPYVVPGDPSSGLLWGIGDQEPEPEGTGDKKVQAYNFRICLTDSTENRIPIRKPDGYDANRYELFLRLIEATGSESIYNHFIWSRMPNRKTDINNKGAFSTDMIGMNWDYPEAGYEERTEIIEAHEQYTKGLLWFLGNDPRVPENMRKEMQQWGYPKDEYVDHGHFTPQLYIREARRMIGEYVMTEHNCTGKLTVKDGIGLAAYTMDSHNCQRLVVSGMVKNEGDVQIGGFSPYPISYRSITPQREECTNLLVPVDLSATHIAYGSIRMEPVFMVLGQSAAVAASLAIDSGSIVQEVPIETLQRILQKDPLLDDTPPEIVIDDADSTLFSAEGTWNHEKKVWRDRSNWFGYMLNTESNAKSRKATFDIHVPRKGNYRVFYYCPHLRHKTDTWQDILSELPYMLRIGDQVVTGTIPFRASHASWYELGEFFFRPGEYSFLTVDGGGKDGVFAADAILIMPD